MSSKTILIDIGLTNREVYCLIQRASDFLFFTNTLGTPFVSDYSEECTLFLTEDEIIKGLYRLQTNNAIIWPDGEYFIRAYVKSGDIIDISLDIEEGGGSTTMFIRDDKEVTMDHSINSLSAFLNKILFGTTKVVNNQIASTSQEKVFIQINPQPGTSPVTTPVFTKNSTSKSVSYGDGSKVIIGD